jgi:2-C-methyl-D-erythritol 2,4-cyclodiphosphate synthase
MTGFRAGTGYDIHRLAGARPLIIGGVTIPHPTGPVGHSDGDVLLHAVIDALLGAAGLGDIGSHFPPSDDRWRGAASVDLLNRAFTMVQAAGFQVENVDATVVLERPRLSAYLPAAAANIAAALKLPAGCVNIKAKTNEGLDAIGQGRAVAAHCVVLLSHAGAG